MLTWLGRMLSARRRPLRVTFLSKAESDPVWREGWLISVDTQGASFASRAHGGDVECLPWGSIGSIRIGERDADEEADAETEARPAFFAGAQSRKG